MNLGTAHVRMVVAGLMPFTPCRQAPLAKGIAICNCARTPFCSTPSRPHRPVHFNTNNVRGNETKSTLKHKHVNKQTRTTQTHSQNNRQKHKPYNQTCKQRDNINKQSHTQTSSQTHKQRTRQTHKQNNDANSQKHNKPTNTQTNTPTNKHTNTNTPSEKSLLQGSLKPKRLRTIH